MTDQSLILVNIENNVATVTLNRPEKHNALTGVMMENFVSLLEQLDEDPNVRVIVLTGAGEKSFCSGADLGGMSDNNEKQTLQFKKHVTKFRNCLLILNEIKKPTIAAVNGYALAGGLGLATSCDITFAIESATFGAPEINVGLWGMMISAPLIQTIGYKKTYELFYTGKKISAQQAKEIGLVNEVYTKEQFLTEVKSFAEQLATRNPTALSFGKEAMQMIKNMEYEKSLSYLRDQVVLLGETEDAKEGMNAFLEKRQPVWRGR